MNQEQLEHIKQDMEKQNITNYSTRQGNNCIIVSYHRVECYYRFNQDNQIIEVIYD